MPGALPTTMGAPGATDRALEAAGVLGGLLLLAAFVTEVRSDLNCVRMASIALLVAVSLGLVRLATEISLIVAT